MVLRDTVQRRSSQPPRNRSASRLGVAESLESLPSYSTPTRCAHCLLHTRDTSTISVCSGMHTLTGMQSLQNLVIAPRYSIRKSVLTAQVAKHAGGTATIPAAGAHAAAGQQHARPFRPHLLVRSRAAGLPGWRCSRQRSLPPCRAVLYDAGPTVGIHALCHCQSGLSLLNTIHPHSRQ